MEIRVRFHSSQTCALRREFSAPFSLRHLPVAPDASPEMRREVLARLVSQILKTHLREIVDVAADTGTDGKVRANVSTRPLEATNKIPGDVLAGRMERRGALVP